MGAVYTYSPEAVIFTFGGYVLSGWRDIKILRNSKPYTQVKGIRGKSTRIRNPDTSALVSISCIQTGTANAVLSEIVNQDMNLGTGRIELQIKDLSGETLFNSQEAYISGFPEVVFGAVIEYRMWEIVCNTSSLVVGGNVSTDNSVFSKVFDAIDVF